MAANAASARGAGAQSGTLADGMPTDSPEHASSMQPDSPSVPPAFPPPPFNAALPLEDQHHQVSANITGTGALYKPPTWASSAGTSETLKKPTAHEAELQPGDSPDGTISIRRLLNSKPVVLLITYACPLAGLAALLLGMLHIVACFAILYASDHAPITGWQYAPQVYLAILTAISNKALAFAVVQGTVVTWWLKAIRGTTLAQLHHDWASGMHVWQAIGAGRHFSMLAFACLCATFVAVDGPLLQSASYVKPEVPSDEVTLHVSMAPQLPAHFSGWTLYPQLADGTKATDTTNDFLPVLRSHSRGELMRDFISGCVGTCIATVRAPALNFVSCEKESFPRDYTLPPTDEETTALDVTAYAPPTKRSAFATSSSVYIGAQELLDVNIAMPDDDVTRSCKGTLVSRKCSYISGIAEYPVRIQDGVVTFLEPPVHPNIVATSNNTAIDEDIVKERDLLYHSGGYVRTTLSGIAHSVNIDFLSRAGLMPMVANDTPVLLGRHPNIFKYMANWETWSMAQDCAPEWVDPLDDIVTLANEMMFRTGIYTAQKYNNSWLSERLDPGETAYYNVTGTRIDAVNVFRTDWGYFAGAAVLEVVTISAILFTLYGWWRLDPERSLSPLEIAKAFDAPLLEEFEPDQKGSKIAKVGGQQKVRYGLIQDEEAGVARRAFARI